MHRSAPHGLLVVALPGAGCQRGESGQLEPLAGGRYGDLREAAHERLRAPAGHGRRAWPCWRGPR
eukprot:6687188-Pyramimonas_sp.AAC.1